MGEIFVEYSSPAVSRGWMWAMRAATLVLLLAFLFPPLYSALTDSQPLPSFYLLVVLYGGLLWALLENPPSKAALASAVSMSAFPLGLILLGGVTAGWEAMRGVTHMMTQWQGPWALLPGAQLIMLAGALAALVALKRGRRSAGAKWAMRLAAAGSMGLLAAPVRWNAWATWEYGYLGYLWSLLWQLAGVLLCVVLLWALRKPLVEMNQEARGALLLAAGTGTYLLLYSLGQLFGQTVAISGSVSTQPGSALPAILFLGGLIVGNGVLGVAAVRVYYKIGKAAGDAATLVKALFLFGLCWATFGALLGDEMRREHWRGHGNEASAIGSLRTINTMEVTYASTYGKGFSATLAALGPPAKGVAASAAAADLIDAVLAGGQKSGYIFEYTAGAPERDGHILHYSVSARPVSPGVTGQRSFFTDESGVIRFAVEGRAANAKDPPI